LYGAASVARESFRLSAGPDWRTGSTGYSFVPTGIDRPDPARNVDELRTLLGDEAFSEAWAQGEAMSPDEALIYALEEAGPELVSPPSAQRSS
jgi:hypothetical protein